MFNHYACLSLGQSPRTHRGVSHPQSKALGRGGVATGRGLEWVFGVLVDESNEVLERAGTIVVDEFAGSSLLELDGWETGDAERSRRGNVVLSKRGNGVRRCSEVDAFMKRTP